jgi:putative nucleotidyltransferase with HDIG domain
MPAEHATHHPYPSHRPYLPLRAGRHGAASNQQNSAYAALTELNRDLQRSGHFDERLDRWVSTLRSLLPCDRYQLLVQETHIPLGKALLAARFHSANFDVFSSEQNHPVYKLRLERAEPQIFHGQRVFLTQEPGPTVDEAVDQILLPIWSDGQPIGFMVMIRLSKQGFSSDDLKLAENILDVGIIALENALLKREIHIQNHLFNRLTPLTQALDRPHRTGEITEAIGQGALALSGADRIAVYGADPHDQVMHVWSSGLTSLSLGRILSASTETGKHSANGVNQMVLASDTENLPDGSFLKQLASDEGIRALALCPIVFGQKKIANIDCYYNDPRELSRSEKNALTLFSQVAAVALQNTRLSDELDDTYTEAVLTLAKALDIRDAYTARHSQRLAAWAENTARKFNCSPEDIRTIRWAALLHDIGKIGIPDAILLKAGPLSDDEWKVMKRHPELGAEIVAPLKRLSSVSPIIRAHQEKFDGSGYPDGLRGDAIPLPARILTVVDAFGAMTDNRVFRKARSKDEAIEELKRCAGRHFDRSVVEVFFEVIHEEVVL